MDTILRQALEALAEIDKLLRIPAKGGNDALQTIAALKALQAERDKAYRIAVMHSDIISNHCIAMQAAAIDAQLRHPARGMEWIFNTLAGPGHLPNVDVAAALPFAHEKGPAQAWFDAKSAEHEAFRANHPGPALPRGMEELHWLPAAGQKPEAMQTVLLWTGDAEYPCSLGYWDDQLQQWIDDGSGGELGGVTHYAEQPKGPTP